MFEQVCLVSFHTAEIVGDSLTMKDFSWSDVDFFYRWVSLLSFLLSRLTSNLAANRVNPRVCVRACLHEETWLTRPVEFWRCFWEKRSFNWNGHDPSHSFGRRSLFLSFYFYFLFFSLTLPKKNWTLHMKFRFWHYITMISLECNFKCISHEMWFRLENSVFQNVKKAWNSKVMRKSDIQI